MVFTLKTGVYLHTAYAQASDGSVGFSTTSATDAAYLGQYTDASATDATDPSRYTWTPIDLGAGAELVDEAGEEVDDGTEGLIDLLNRDLYDTGQFAPDTQATGDRKVQTYFQPDEPDPEEYVFGVGDLWQDTDDGNHLYRWDGTAWADAQDGGISAATELAQAADTKATTADEKAQAAGTTAQAVQTALAGLTKIQDGEVLIDGDKVYLSAAFVRSIFAQDITATGTITGAKLDGAVIKGNAIDISAFQGGYGHGVSLKSDIVIPDGDTKGYMSLILQAMSDGFATAEANAKITLAASGEIEATGTVVNIDANVIQFTLPNGSFRPYYTAGDTVTITRMYCAGGVTGSGTNLYFYVPLAKPLVGVSKVTISNPTKAIITGRKIEGGYIAQEATVSSLGTPSCVPYENGVTIGIKATSAYSTKNNTPVTVTPENLVLKFT